MFALRMRRIWVSSAPHVDEARTAIQREELAQTESATGVPSFPVDRELYQESEATGNQPASLQDVTHCHHTA